MGRSPLLVHDAQVCKTRVILSRNDDIRLLPDGALVANSGMPTMHVLLIYSVLRSLYSTG